MRQHFVPRQANSREAAVLIDAAHEAPVAKAGAKNLRLSRPRAWMSPATLIVFEYLPILLISFILPESTYQLLWFEPKYVTVETTLIHFGVCAAFLGGFFAPRLIDRGTAPRHAMLQITPAGIRLLYRFFWSCFFLSLFGYVFFYITAVMKGFTPALILAALAGRNNLANEIKFFYFTSVSGVSSCMQFGVAAILVGTLLSFIEGWRSIKWPMITIAVLTVSRAFVLSERLALIELLVPAAVLAAYIQYSRIGSRFYKRVFTIGPAFAPGVLYLFFTVAEYFRSWNSYYAAKTSTSVWLFSFGRLVGYYATSINNSALMYYNSESSSLPLHTLSMLWRFPVIGDLLGTRELTVEMDRIWAERLRSDANPEFNNGGGMYPPLVDYGIAGGLVWWFVVGLFAYFLYRRFREGRLSGLFLFPIFYIGLLEGPRVLYWTNGRAFPQIISLILLSVLMRKYYKVSRG